MPDGDPAVRPARRRFSAQYKLAILEEYDLGDVDTVLVATLSAHGPAAIGDHRSATLREDAHWSK